MSNASIIALVILVPFVAVFIYATWHEYRRYRSEGKSSYGLSYDAETNTTHVGALPEDEEGFDPDDFDPELTEVAQATDQEQATDQTDKTDTSETNKTEQETRT